MVNLKYVTTAAAIAALLNATPANAFIGARAVFFPATDTWLYNPNIATGITIGTHGISNQQTVTSQFFCHYNYKAIIDPTLGAIKSTFSIIANFPQQLGMPGFHISHFFNPVNNQMQLEIDAASDDGSHSSAWLSEPIPYDNADRTKGWHTINLAGDTARGAAEFELDGNPGVWNGVSLDNTGFNRTIVNTAWMVGGWPAAGSFTSGVTEVYKGSLAQLMCDFSPNIFDIIADPNLQPAPTVATFITPVNPPGPTRYAVHDFGTWCLGPFALFTGNAPFICMRNGAAEFPYNNGGQFLITGDGGGNLQDAPDSPFDPVP